MDLRKPKAIHSVREFFNELLTITFGILIALSLEALVEHHRINAALGYSSDDFRAELSRNRADVLDDVKASQETQRSLQRVIKIGRALLLHTPPSDKSPLSLSRRFLSLQSAAWSGALSTQIMSHFPHEEERAIARAYSNQNSFSETERAAQQQWFGLVGYIGGADQLSDDQIRAGLLEASEANEYLTTLQESERHLISDYDLALKALGR